MYLKTPRLVFFGLTSALCTATTALTLWGLVVGYQQKHKVRDALQAKLIIGDILGAGGAVAAAAAISSGLCTLMWFFIVFRPHMKQTLKLVRLKEAAFLFSVIFFIATLIPATYITATKSGVVRKPGVSSALLANIIKLGGMSLAYSDQKAPKAFLITGWLAMLSTFVSFILVSLEARYVLKNGPDGEIGEIIGHSTRAETHAGPHTHAVGSDGELDEKSSTPTHVA